MFNYYKDTVLSVRKKGRPKRLDWRLAKRTTVLKKNVFFNLFFPGFKLGKKNPNFLIDLTGK